MLRRLYDWTMSLAATRHAEKALFGVSFVESSVFPIPPDVLLIPMVLARRESWMRLALICTIGSVLGAFLGYAIGMFLYETIGQPVPIDLELVVLRVLVPLVLELGQRLLRRRQLLLQVGHPLLLAHLDLCLGDERRERVADADMHHQEWVDRLHL